MGCQRSAQPTDLLSKLDEAPECVFRLGERALHGAVGFLERKLDVLECLEVALENPVEQIGEEIRVRRDDPSPRSLPHVP